jgi:alginate O-acetyltransferase complex protein AlgI
MLFNSAAYLIFLPIVVALFWLVPFRFRVALLTIASYIFYLYWKPIYGILIFALTLVNYIFGLLIEKYSNHRKLVLTLGIITNVLVLGYFKYSNFILDLSNKLMGVFGHHEPPIVLQIILPLGISFFTFEFIHYLVDVYKGGKPVKGFLDFTLFAAFFPTKIAGPIKRYQDFVPQLHEPQKITKTQFNEGVELIIFGLFKKVVLADSLAVLVDRCFSHPALLNGADFWLACWTFGFQVYFDFSGYTDVARGSAMLMGFRIPENFKQPFLAESVFDFWRRWHISLSTWLRDYVYFALGGSRNGPWFTYINLMITMGICGLWHGAGDHYVFWGLFAGMTIVVHRLWQIACERMAALRAVQTAAWFKPIAIFLTFQAFAMGLAIFLSPNMQMAGVALGRMLCLVPQPAGTVFWKPTILNTESSVIFALIPLLLIVFYAMQFVVAKFKNQTPGIMPEPRWLPGFKPVYLAGLIILLLVLSPDIAPQFVYFQF